jgi:hypothetical protein
VEYTTFNEYISGINNKLEILTKTVNDIHTQMSNNSNTINNLINRVLNLEMNVGQDTSTIIPDNTYTVKCYINDDKGNKISNVSISDIKSIEQIDDSGTTYPEYMGNISNIVDYEYDSEDKCFIFTFKGQYAIQATLSKTGYKENIMKIAYDSGINVYVELTAEEAGSNLIIEPYLLQLTIKDSLTKNTINANVVQGTTVLGTARNGILAVMLEENTSTKISIQHDDYNPVNIELPNNIENDITQEIREITMDRKALANNVDLTLTVKDINGIYLTNYKLYYASAVYDENGNISEHLERISGNAIDRSIDNIDAPVIWLDSNKPSVIVIDANSDSEEGNIYQKYYLPIEWNSRYLKKTVTVKSLSTNYDMFCVTMTVNNMPGLSIKAVKSDLYMNLKITSIDSSNPSILYQTYTPITEENHSQIIYRFYVYNASSSGVVISVDPCYFFDSYNSGTLFTNSDIVLNIKSSASTSTPEPDTGGESDTTESTTTGSN